MAAGHLLADGRSACRSEGEQNAVLCNLDRPINRRTRRRKDPRESFGTEPLSSRFAVFCLGLAVSRYGDALYSVVWMASFYELTHSGTALGLLMLCRFLPEVILGPVAGTWIDRCDRRMVLVAVDLVRAAAVAALAGVGGSPLAFYTATLLLAGCEACHYPARQGVLPDIVREDELLKANSCLNASGSMVAALGACTGGLILSRTYAGVGFLANGLSFLLSAAATAVSVPKARRPENPPCGILSDLSAGWCYLAGNRPVLGATLGVAIMWLGIAASDAVLVVFVRDSLCLAPAYLGYLRTAIGLGGMLGSLATLRRSSHLREMNSLTLSLGLTAVCFGLLAGTSTFGSAVTVYTLGCAAATAAENLRNTIQLRVPADMRGRLAATGAALETLGYLLVVTVAPMLTEFVPVRAILLGGAVLMLVGFLVLRLLPQKQSTASDWACCIF